MSNYNPRILVHVFNGLREEFQRFNQVSSDTLNQAEHTQKCAQERFNQALRSSAIALNQAQSDLENVQVVDKEVHDLLLSCTTAIETAHQIVEMVDRSRRQAEITLATWQNELQKALAWQARAEARLASAIQEYERAQRNLTSAQQNLASAEASLRRCRNDSERKNCSGEERAHNTAKEAVVLAIQELQEKEIEVQAAQEELAQAKARVCCCQQAVGYAEKAVQHANIATEQAKQALNEAERSLESAESANRAVTKASTKAIEEQEQAEQATNQVHQAESFINQAKVSVQRARSKADSAYNLAKRGNQELEYRRDQLVRLNQISSGFWGSVEKGVAVVQIAGSLLGGIASTPVPDISRLGSQGREDLVNEAGMRSSSVNEEEIKRRQEEIDTAMRVANEPTISNPPDP
jgi:chromosome segregation ATPase